MVQIQALLLGLIALLVPIFASGATTSVVAPDLTTSFFGFMALGVFAFAYLLVMAEEFLHLRKSKPVIVAAGIIWCLIALAYQQMGLHHLAEESVRHALLEYAELMLFLLVAMTYINALEERQVFNALRAWLVGKGFSLRTLFWLTGILAFFISPIADNLTTALLMCAVVMAVGGDDRRFVSLGCINIVVAANAGGAFSPCGDITTLMVWQRGIIDFFGFFKLFIPSLVNYLVPACIMFLAVPNAMPATSDESVRMRRGARAIMVLFLLTIVTAVSFHNFLELPPVIGMLTGLGYLQFFGFYLRMSHARWHTDDMQDNFVSDLAPFDVFSKVARAEWDTLLFFYGVILCVAGLGQIGYLAMTSELMYQTWGATAANVIVGFLSAIVDNIPVMFAVLSMNPPMDETQWLLVTLTAGVGGSMLSIGSAAGVALMGQARGIYTFFGHLKWTPAIALGYAASIIVHLLIN